MDGLFILYFVTYFPFTGDYAPALNTATQAAFMQSGIKSDFEVVKRAAEKRIPKPVAQAAVVYNVASKKAISWRGRTLDGTITPRSVALSLHVEF